MEMLNREHCSLSGSPCSSVVGVGRMNSVAVVVGKQALLFPLQKSTSYYDRTQFSFACPLSIK